MEEISGILDEIRRRREKEKLRYFVPNGKQAEFIRLVGEGNKFIYVLSAGNGLGKTALVMNLLGNLCYGPQNQWFQYPLFQNWPYPKRVRIGTESKNVEEIGAIDTEIKVWWPESRYKRSKAGKLYYSQYEADTGWLVDKMSYEQDTKEWESATLGLVIFDEPPPEDIFNACITRMRMGGLIICSMTPLNAGGWIFDKLLDDQTKDVSLVYGDMEDNCQEHGERGILSHSHIQRIIEKLDPEEVDARVHGRPMHLSRTIFGRHFDRNVHIVEDDLQPAQGSQWGMVVDPADGKPFAIGWFWVDKTGTIVFDDEYPNEDWLKCTDRTYSLKDYVDLFFAKEEGRKLEWRILDRHFGNNRSVRTGKTLKEDFYEKHNIDFQDSYNCEKEVESGIICVKDYLQFDKTKPLDSLNTPRLFVKKRCRNIIKALERWSRKKDSYEYEPKSPYKDHADLVRYACMAHPEVYVSQPLPPRSVGYVLGRT